MDPRLTAITAQTHRQELRAGAERARAHRAWPDDGLPPAAPAEGRVKHRVLHPFAVMATLLTD